MQGRTKMAIGRLYMMGEGKENFFRKRALATRDIHDSKGG